jgi:hypothetical protein
VREKRGPGSPKPPRWSAERRASRVMGRKAPRKRLTCRVMARPTGALAQHPNVSRRSAHPSTGVSEAKSQSPDAAMRARERDDVRRRQGYGGPGHLPAEASKAGGLFEMVKNAAGDVRPHPEERAREKRSSDSNARAPHFRAAPQHEGEGRGAFWPNEPNAVVPAKAETWDRRPVFMGPRLSARCAGVDRDDAEVGWAKSLSLPSRVGKGAGRFCPRGRAEQRAFAHPTAVRGHGRDDGAWVS